MTKRMCIFAVLVAGLLASSGAVAQVVLTGGEVRTGTGEVIENGVVVIGADGKIGAVGANVATPANATVIDVSGKVVTPGLIDSTTQLGVAEIWAVSDTRDSDAGPIDAQRDPIRAAFRVADAFNPNSTNIPIQRAGGVTAALVMPGGGLIAGQGAFVELDGEFGAARIIEPSAALEVSLGGQSDGSRGVAMLRLREVFDDAKFFATNTQRFDENRSRMLSASRLDLAALNAATQAKKPVFFEVHRASDILAVLDLSREYGLRAVIVGGAEAWMVADELARENVSVVVNPLYNLPWSFDMLGTRDDNAARLAKAGVKVAISPFDTHHARNLRFLAGNAVREGMDPGAALQAITLHAATAAGVEDRYGSIEAGKVGNVVVWSGDPFEFSTAVEAVYIAGKAVDLENRQTKLFERYRTLERRGEVPGLTRPSPAPKETETPQEK